MNIFQFLPTLWILVFWEKNNKLTLDATRDPSILLSLCLRDRSTCISNVD